ncbi:proteinase inhibitor I78 [Streptomyces sp. PRB2-1]|uniref:Proteinase inhibitor I78 n=1 Tax=Actinacidiphila epipremni TaxID=2053013 RepID=A0ABX1A1L9_9ACTN|nr:proteinase inhibitor I78 [Actinacidiphila epipremni]
MPRTGGPGKPFPGDVPRDDLDSYVGLPREEAERQARARGWDPVRSLPRDAVVTMEYLAGRLNFTVDGDRVVRCWMG